MIPFAIGYAIHGSPRGRADRVSLGRARAHLPAPPRDLLDQLDLPLLGQPPLPRQRRVEEQPVARDLSFGEAWHHNHHAFPSSAYHGLKRWEIDLSGLVISALEKIGLAWDVTRIPPERQAAKLA